VFTDHAHPVPVAAVVKQFRSADTSTPADSTTTGAPAPFTVPAAGIYRYTTTGEESADALGGATHKYPAETTITVTADSCGVMLRWDALKERRDQWGLCASSTGIGLQPQGLQYHEFFGRGDPENYECPSSVALIGRSTAAGAPMAQDCSLGGARWQPTWQVLGPEQRTVAGVVVPVQHVRETIDSNATYDEHTTVDWYLDAHGLPVAANSTKESKSPSPIGAITYHETYTLALESLTPLR
jgi:hypothetical protein